MKKRRKHSRCLNCDEPLERKDNYCSNCGQENTDHHVSIQLLLKEFTSNFFSLDSRFAHTFMPFLFNPGKITNAFLAGKRVFYANPIRWYLVISIFHFFFMAKMFEPTVKDKKQRSFGDNKELTAAKFDSLYHLPDSVHNDWPLSDQQQAMVGHLIETTDLAADEILDSLKVDTSGSWAKELAATRLVRIFQETSASLNTYLMSQIPLIIFFILPIHAFLLKLFFWRKGLYIKHLVHSLHIHSFFFFLLGWVWVLSLLINDFEDYGLPASGFITFVYVIFSFKNVYHVKLFWSGFRALWIGLFYTFAVAISLIIGVVISLALI